MGEYRSEYYYVTTGTGLLSSRELTGSHMASNFKIIVHRNSENLHLKLIGDFDGTSAFELLDELKRSGRGAQKVIIHTSGLKKVFPFGRNVFQNNFSDLNSHSLRVLFTGENASQIAPENSVCLKALSYQH